MSTVYIQNETIDHLRMINDTGAALEQYEFTVIGNYAAVADEGTEIAADARGSFHVESSILCQVKDFVTGEGTFATPNAPVYWDPVTGDFSDTETVGYYEVGQVVEVLDGNGVMVFSKYLLAVEIES